MGNLTQRSMEELNKAVSQLLGNLIYDFDTTKRRLIEVNGEIQKRLTHQKNVQ